jgi:hypothetical protein
MRVTLYLPDDLGRVAKEAGLNLSGLLRGTVERALRDESGEEPQRVTGAAVTRRAVPGGVELVVFVPEGSGPADR